ncbi:hypothetical protein E2542_SST21622 [Spatholobus suberectus]|nr:hypothetical protein E2542_SST21622 [Spatholobus suberectus]
MQLNFQSPTTLRWIGSPRGRAEIGVVGGDSRRKVGVGRGLASEKIRRRNERNRKLSSYNWCETRIRRLQVFNSKSWLLCASQTDEDGEATRRTTPRFVLKRHAS